ncbi:MAG: TPM domain-containing protein [Acidaminococcaceae bacterium]|nr:TPM domain-containing protein [Acidaminococcaceae bacterium]MBQ9697401.1 TPM domain-containing protein [Acidaminococcaceae bacterium]MBR1589705.1 TPM domain-containing protein [Acidaminococcaceae bacterium]
MKKIFAIVTLLVSLVLSVTTGFVGTAAAAQQYPSLVDGATLLQPVDKTNVLNTLRQIETKHGIRCAVLTVKSTQGMDIRDYAQAVQDQYFANAEKGSILLVVNMSTRKWHITTDKTMRTKIIDKVVTGQLKQAFLNDLSKGNYAASFTKYGRKVDELMTYYEKEGEAYDPSKEFNFGALGIGGIISLLIGGGVKKSMVASMSNVTNAVSAGQYLKRDTFNLIGQNDRYLYTHTTVVPKAKSRNNDSGSSGGSGGHGGGGGSF